MLGSIESGVDFEKRILGIYQQCRTSEEIDAPFRTLQAEMDEQIRTRSTTLAARSSSTSKRTCTSACVSSLEIEQRLGDPAVALHSFIVSNTSSATMRRQWGMEKSDMQKRHILFQEEDKESTIALAGPPHLRHGLHFVPVQGVLQSSRQALVKQDTHESAERPSPVPER